MMKRIKQIRDRMSHPLKHSDQHENGQNNASNLKQPLNNQASKQIPPKPKRSLPNGKTHSSNGVICNGDVDIMTAKTQNDSIETEALPVSNGVNNLSEDNHLSSDEKRKQVSNNNPLDTKEETKDKNLAAKAQNGTIVPNFSYKQALLSGMRQTPQPIPPPNNDQQTVQKERPMSPTAKPTDASQGSANARRSNPVRTNQRQATNLTYKHAPLPQRNRNKSQNGNSKQNGISAHNGTTTTIAVVASSNGAKKPGKTDHSVKYCEQVVSTCTDLHVNTMDKAQRVDIVAKDKSILKANSCKVDTEMTEKNKMHPLKNSDQTLSSSAGSKNAQNTIYQKDIVNGVSYSAYDQLTSKHHCKSPTVSDKSDNSIIKGDQPNSVFSDNNKTKENGKVVDVMIPSEADNKTNVVSLVKAKETEHTPLALSSIKDMLAKINSEIASVKERSVLSVEPPVEKKDVEQVNPVSSNVINGDTGKQKVVRFSDIEDVLKFRTVFDEKKMNRMSEYHKARRLEKGMFHDKSNENSVSLEQVREALNYANTLEYCPESEENLRESGSMSEERQVKRFPPKIKHSQSDSDKDSVSKFNLLTPFKAMPKQKDETETLICDEPNLQDEDEIHEEMVPPSITSVPCKPNGQNEAKKPEQVMPNDKNEDSDLTPPDFSGLNDIPMDYFYSFPEEESESESEFAEEIEESTDTNPEKSSDETADKGFEHVAGKTEEIDDEVKAFQEKMVRLREEMKNLRKTHALREVINLNGVSKPEMTISDIGTKRITQKDQTCTPTEREGNMCKAEIKDTINAIPAENDLLTKKNHTSESDLEFFTESQKGDMEAILNRYTELDINRAKCHLQAGECVSIDNKEEKITLNAEKLQETTKTLDSTAINSFDSTQITTTERSSSVSSFNDDIDLEDESTVARPKTYTRQRIDLDRVEKRLELVYNLMDKIEGMQRQMKTVQEGMVQANKLLFDMMECTMEEFTATTPSS